MKECPKCGQDVSHTHQSEEPDVGIFGSGWYCESCDLFIPEEDQENDPRDWDYD